MRKICSHEAWYLLKNCSQETFETWILRLGKLAISCLKNEEYSHSVLGTLKSWFYESAAIAISDCQNTENLLNEACYMRKICSHEAW